MLGRFTVKSSPDVITHAKKASLLKATREQRYQTFFFITSSLGLRLAEALSIKGQDIDAEQMHFFIRMDKK